MVSALTTGWAVRSGFSIVECPSTIHYALRKATENGRRAGTDLAGESGMRLRGRFLVWFGGRRTVRGAWFVLSRRDCGAQDSRARRIDTNHSGSSRTMATFEADVTIACPVETVFDFLIRPANVERISPSIGGLEIVSAPECLAEGSRIELALRGFGRSLTIVHEVIRFARPSGFTVEQTEGPMKLWVHEHTFTADENNRTVLVDRITFEPPGGLLGRFVSEGRVLESLRQGMEHRHRELKRHLEQQLSTGSS